VSIVHREQRQVTQIGGQYRNIRHLTEESRLRKSVTRLDNCPFKVVCTRKEGIWTIEETNSAHNHDTTFEDLIALPEGRRLSEAEREEVLASTIAGITPKQILSQLRLKFDNHHSGQKEIYNERSRLKEQELGGRGSMERLLESLTEYNYTKHVRLDDENNIQAIFIIRIIKISAVSLSSPKRKMDKVHVVNGFNMYRKAFAKQESEPKNKDKSNSLCKYFGILHETEMV
jgi:hypothetical protein